MAGLLLVGGYILVRAVFRAYLARTGSASSALGRSSASLASRPEPLRAVEEGTSGIDFSASTGWFKPDKYY